LSRPFGAGIRRFAARASRTASWTSASPLPGRRTGASARSSAACSARPNQRRPH